MSALRLEEIRNFNAFGHEADGTKASYIFAFISLINHNTKGLNTYRGYENGIAGVKALRNIEKGE